MTNLTLEIVVVFLFLLSIWFLFVLKNINWISLNYLKIKNIDNWFVFMNKCNDKKK